MLTCIALMLGVSLAELPSLALQVETEARALTAQTEITPSLLAGIEEFSGHAEQLSTALRQAGVEQDLPCIFHGIAEDARERAAEFEAVGDTGAHAAAFTNFRVLLEDAILIAPMAASAAAEASQIVAAR
jgi:hypothetical protein